MNQTFNAIQVCIRSTLLRTHQNICDVRRKVHKFMRSSWVEFIWCWNVESRPEQKRVTNSVNAWVHCLPPYNIKEYRKGSTTFNLIIWNNFKLEHSPASFLNTRVKSNGILSWWMANKNSFQFVSSQINIPSWCCVTDKSRGTNLCVWLHEWTGKSTTSEVRTN